MDIRTENGTLYISLPERIDTSNADAVGEELTALLSGNPHDSLVLEANSTEYISSAGLRVILKVKKTDKNLKIAGVSAEVYDIFDMTGFTEMIDIEKAYRQLSVEGCKIIGEGAKGTVYRYSEDTIVKVYKSADSLPDIKNERELARRAFVLGIPTAISYDIVKVGDNFGSVFELLDAKSFSQLIVEEPENRDKYIKEYALLLKKIHDTEVSKSDMPCVKKTPEKWLKSASGYIGDERTEKIKKLIDETPDKANMLHCDYHTNNVMMQNGETLLIDMDTLSYGHPIFDLATVCFAYFAYSEIEPDNTDKFLGMPKESAKEVWKKTLPIYLDTDDENKIKEVEDKAMLLCCLRMIHHVLRRKGEDSDMFKKTLEFATEKIDGILPTVTTLEF